MSIRVLWTLIGLLTSSAAFADFKPDFGAVVRDLQQTSRNTDRLTLVFWLPDEYWRMSMQSRGALTPAAVDKLIGVLDSYLMIAAVDGQIGLAGAIDFTDEAGLRREVSIEDRAGNRVDPLDPDALPGSIKNMVDVMHPLFANMMGSMGAHVQIFVFPAIGKDGKRIAEATKDGSLTVHLGSNVFRYRLPLGSLLPPMMDTKTGESFPGSYQFNPFTGSRLSPSPANK